VKLGKISLGQRLGPKHRGEGRTGGGKREAGYAKLLTRLAKRPEQPEEASSKRRGEISFGG